MDKVTGPLHMLPTRDSLQIERHTQAESKEVKNMFHENFKKLK